MRRRRRGRRQLTGEPLEELLELIWTLKEEGKDGLAQFVATSGNADAGVILKDLEEKGYVEVEDAM